MASPASSTTNSSVGSSPFRAGPYSFSTAARSASWCHHRCTCGATSHVESNCRSLWANGRKTNATRPSCCHRHRPASGNGRRQQHWSSTEPAHGRVVLVVDAFDVVVVDDWVEGVDGVVADVGAPAGALDRVVG